MPIIAPQKTSLDVYDINGARKAGVPEEEISSYLKTKFNPQYDFDGASKSGVPLKEINDHILGKLNNPNPIGNVDLLKKGLIEGKDRIVDVGKPIADGLVTGGVTIGTGNPALGFAAGAGTDMLLQQLQSKIAKSKNRTTLADLAGTDKGGFGETVANGIQNNALNELMGKVFDKVGGKLKGLVSPTVDPALESLKPTFSQYGNNPKSISSVIENIWNPGGKSAALNNSADLARGQVGDLVKKISGRSLSVVPDITNDVLGKDVQNISRISVDNLNSRFDDGKRTVETIGKLNSAPVVNTQTLPSGNVNPFPKTTQIEAPIQLNNTVKAAEDFLKERQKFYGNQGFQSATDSDKKLITQAQTILSHTNNGQNPIPYRDAMDLLHGPNGDGGLNGMSSLKPGELNQTKSIQSQFADSLHNDIEGSISKWNDPGKTALKGYQDSRVAAETKKLLYEGGNVKQLVENVNSPISQIDSALKDPIQTQRLLNASQFNGLKSQNMRQDLAGYRLNQIWQKADNGAKGIDGNALLSEWNNPEMAKTKDLLYSKQTQDQIGEFFNNVNKVSQSGVGGNYQKIRMTMRGLELSSSLFTGIVSGNPLHGLSAAGGFAAMELPMLGVAKILSNPARAQILQKLIIGAPLESSEAQAGRLLMSGLNGMTVGLLNSKGEKVNVQVRDGKVE